MGEGEDTSERASLWMPEKGRQEPVGGASGAHLCHRGGLSEGPVCVIAEARLGVTTKHCCHPTTVAVLLSGRIFQATTVTTKKNRSLSATVVARAQ